MFTIFIYHFLFEYLKKVNRLKVIVLQSSIMSFHNKLRHNIYFP